MTIKLFIFKLRILFKDLIVFVKSCDFDFSNEFDEFYYEKIEKNLKSNDEKIRKKSIELFNTLLNKSHDNSIICKIFDKSSKLFFGNNFIKKIFSF